MRETDKQTEMNYYGKTIHETMRKFRTTEYGLTDQEVSASRSEFGENKLPEKKQESILSVFLGQFKDPLVLILIASAAISMATGNSDSAVVIFAVLIMNAVLGTAQFVKAQKSLESLKKLSSPSAKVYRDGNQTVIPSAELVCGDIIVLDAGDIVPGDARLIEAHALKLNESSLTGESESAEKITDPLNSDKGVALGDQKNMVFAGSLVTYGRGRGIVTAVGRSTQLGRIAELMDQIREKKTPLQVTMDNFSVKLSIGIILICIIVFGLSLYRNMGISDAFLFAVALAVAAIPEALSSIITISLAIGTSRMADQNAIIKDLSAVEGLGCVSVICSDKTGTLTQNNMTVEHVSAFNGKDRDLELASILCNDTAVVERKTIGDPTETAFIRHYMKHHEDYFRVMRACPRLSEVPFDSVRKLMSTLHNVDGEYVMYVKGALDVILMRSVNLSRDEREEIAAENEELSRQGLRVLGFAMKKYPEQVYLNFGEEYDLEYIGLIAEMDPPREESAQAVADCRAAGIKPVMITGDHKVTASAIAKRIGVLQDGDLAYTGPEIDRMSDDELDEKLANISVYARVSPENKIRIVNAWQKKGEIVAMTGDGVNDGPALKNADVGVAMGIAGTEVAKDSASMILTDDNFATIIKSVLNGRNVYSNIKNAIIYLLSGNFAGIIAVMFCSLCGLPMPFTAVQLLFINLITDSLPALAISMEPMDPSLIKEKPRSRRESILDRSALSSIGLYGVLTAAATMAAYFIGLGWFSQITVSDPGAVTASTMAFSTLCLARLWNGFTCRGKKDIFSMGVFRNPYTIGAFALGAALLMMIITMQFFTTAFGVQNIATELIAWVWILSALPTLFIQIGRMTGLGAGR